MPDYCEVPLRRARDLITQPTLFSLTIETQEHMSVFVGILNAYQ
jgi:hypothetical protein